MTYLSFLLFFVALPIFVLFRTTDRTPLDDARIPFGRALLLILGIAFAYTTPWDNYLVHAQIWSYGDDRVLGALFFVPYEEYAFFLLQPVLTGFWTRFVVRRVGRSSGMPDRVPVLAVAIPAAALLAGVLLLAVGGEQTRYGMLILVWASPVILGLVLFSWRTLVRYRRALAWSIAVPTVYLWVCDAIAIKNGIWTIEPATSLGWNPLGLPVEEALFFLVTNILVVFGLMTFLFGRGRPEAS